MKPGDVYEYISSRSQRHIRLVEYLGNDEWAIENKVKHKFEDEEGWTGWTEYYTSPLISPLTGVFLHEHCKKIS